jgi:hypothetical protein
MAAHISQVLARFRRDPFFDLPIADDLNQLLAEQTVAWGCVTLSAGHDFLDAGTIGGGGSLCTLGGVHGSADGSAKGS